MEAASPYWFRVHFFSVPHKSYTRIDYIFIPSSKMSLTLSCSMGNIVLSDHAPLYLVYSLAEDRALSRRWRFQPYLLKDDKFMSYCTSEFKIFYSVNSPSTDNPSVLWETCKLYSRGLIMSFVASKKREKNEQRKRLESRLAELEKNHTSSPSPDWLKELLSACAALNTFLIQDSEQSLKFAKQKLYEFEDKPGKYLPSLVKKRADSQNIVSITDPNGVRSFDTRTINKHFASF